jgi:methylmalonyl-CoA/ethylmalonyl-CoA epimerase
MTSKIEHIGIAVSDLASAEKIYADILGVEPYKREKVEHQGVITSFFKTGNIKIELLESLNDQSPISSFIKKRGEGVHHVAFLVDDIHKEINRLKKLNFNIINEDPVEGADNKIICFIHPKSTKKVLIELCQNKK